MKTTATNMEEMKRLGIEDTPYKNFYNIINIVIKNKKVKSNYLDGYLYSMSHPGGGYLQRQNVSVDIFCKADNLDDAIRHLSNVYAGDKFKVNISVKEES